MSSIVEIQVRRDEGTLRLIEILRSMPPLRPEQRVNALIEAERLGHPRLLEVALAGTRDLSHHVRKPAIIDVGRYAAALPDDPDHRLRRQLAIDRLFAIIDDGLERNDLRSAAATSLGRFAPLGDGHVCRRLGQLLLKLGQDLRDPGWEIRGYVLTTVGRLACRDTAETVLNLIEQALGLPSDSPEAIPEPVLASVPSQLQFIATQEQAAPLLRRLVLSEEPSAVVTGTAISALSLIRGKDYRIAIDTLSEFLDRTYDESSEQQILMQHRSSAVSSLHRIGDRRAIPTLHRHVRRDIEDDEDVRRHCALAIGELEDPSSEAVLLQVADDGGETAPVRVAAVRGLRRFNDDRTAIELSRIFGSVGDATLRLEIAKSLKYRGESSTFAQRLADRHLRELDATSDRERGQAVLHPGQPAEQLSIRAGSRAVLLVEIDDAGRYVLEARTFGGGDPWLILSDGEEIGRDDDGGGELNAMLEITLQTGTYQLIVGNMADEEGVFAVTVRRGS